MFNKLTDREFEYLEAFMLGDGCLYKAGEKYNPQFSIRRAIKDKDYLFENFCILKRFIRMNEPRHDNIFDKRTNKSYEGFVFSSKNCPEFLETYNRWYLNGTKDVPKDLKLTPLICAIWFCDDGCVIRKSNALSLKLSTHAFSKQGNEFLAKELSKIFNERFAISSENFIYAPHTSTIKFIKYIENYIPNSMNRKIKWNDTDFKNNNLPQRKYRSNHHLNEKEIKILSLVNEEFKNPKQIAAELNDLRNDRAPSYISGYLKIFYDKGHLDRIGIACSYKEPLKYKLNNKGREAYLETISEYSKRNK